MNTSEAVSEAIAALRLASDCGGELDRIHYLETYIRLEKLAVELNRYHAQLVSEGRAAGPNDYLAVMQLLGVSASLDEGNRAAAEDDLPDYCGQVCGGGQCGAGPVCANGIDVETSRPEQRPIRITEMAFGFMLELPSEKVHAFHDGVLAIQEKVVDREVTAVYHEIQIHLDELLNASNRRSTCTVGEESFAENGKDA